MLDGALEGEAAAFGVEERAARGFVGQQSRRYAVIGVGVDAVVDQGDMDSFGQDLEVVGVASVSDEKVPNGRAGHGLDALDGGLGRIGLQDYVAEDGRGYPGSNGFVPQGVGEDGEPMAAWADTAEFAGYAVHEDIGAAGGPVHRNRHAVKVGLAKVAVLAADGLAVSGCGTHGCSLLEVRWSWGGGKRGVRHR